MPQGYITKTKDYWIAPTAVYITLNALGDKNRIQGSVASGARIMCWIEGVSELGYTNGHEYQTWPLSLSPTYFNDNEQKYVYCAIPRSAAVGLQAVIVFPGSQLDIDGKNADGEQVGSTDYLYVYLQGIIGPPAGDPQRRSWTKAIGPDEWGSLDTAGGRKAEQEANTAWYRYSLVDEVVRFLKHIRMEAGSSFDNLVLGGRELDVVAGDGTPADSATAVATPEYVSRHFLSKTTEDTAEERIGFLKGFWVKTKDMFGFSGEGDVTARSGAFSGLLTAMRGIIGKLSSPDYQGGELAGTGWQLTDDDGTGHSRLEVDNIVARMKFVANVLEARKYVALGGNYVYSPASSVVEQVDYYRLVPVPGEDAVREELLGYEYAKVPWLVRLMPLRLRNIILARTRKVKVQVGEAALSSATHFRCWLKADDGTTRTVNTWQPGMLARCQTFDVAESERGTHTDEIYAEAVKNTVYWREVTAVGQGRLPIDDGLTHSYVDLSNQSGHCLAQGDVPSAGDAIVCYGATKEEYANLIVVETVGSDAPALKEFRGVGLQHIGQDNAPGELPRFALTDASGKSCQFTKISPKTGNEFHAPRFYIEVGGGSEPLWNVHRKGTADYFETHDTLYGALPFPGADNQVLLLNDLYSADKKARLYFSQQNQWAEQPVSYGDAWSCRQTGHIHVATPSGWEDNGEYIVKETFKQEIQGDTERSIATSMGFVDGDGNPEWQNVGEYIRSSTESMSRIERRSANGKNMLTGVLTGDGWTDAAGEPLYVDADGEWKIKAPAEGNNSMVSPLLKIEDPCVFSYYGASADVSVVAADGTVLKSPAAMLESLEEDAAHGQRRYRALYATGEIEAGGIEARVVVTFGTVSADNSIWHPQLEAGGSMTAFDASTTEVASTIRQTADGISMEVKDLSDGISRTGIDIEKGTIGMQADRLTLKNMSGEEVMSADGNGNLVTRGTIYADNMFKKVMFAFQTAGLVEQAYMDYDGKLVTDRYVYVRDLQPFEDFDSLEQDGHTYAEYGVALDECIRWTGEVAERYGMNASEGIVYCSAPVDHIIAVDSNSTGQVDMTIRIVPSWKYIGKILEIWNSKNYGNNDLEIITIDNGVEMPDGRRDSISKRVSVTINGTGDTLSREPGEGEQSLTLHYGERVRLLATPIGWLYV